MLILRDKKQFQRLSTKHLRKLCLSYININSVRNKLEALSKFACTRVDFLAISETKVDSSFPTAQFNLPRFRTPYRKDITARSAGYLHMEMGTFHKQSYKIDLSAIVLLTLKFYRLK